MSHFVRTLCKIAVPVTLQGMLQASFSIVDQIMIGQLGEAGIAAVGLCGNFSLIFSVMLGAVCTVAGILMAQFLGGGGARRGVVQSGCEPCLRGCAGGAVSAGGRRLPNTDFRALYGG